MMRTQWMLGGACAMMLHAGALGASPTIAEIAPPETIAVVGVDDFANARELFDASFLGALWRDQEMQDWLDEFLNEGGIADEFADSDLGAMIDEALDNAGLERDELSMPTGAVGAALWWGEDPDIDEVGPRWFAVCDFGDAGEDMRAMAESMIEVLGDEETLEVTDDEYEDADIWLIELVEADDADDEDIDEWDYEPEPWIDHAHFAWIEDTLVIAGDRGALERAIDRINGEEMGTLADGDVFADMQRQIDGAQVYAAAFVAPMLEAWVPAEAEMGFEIDPMLDALGIMDVHSLSAGVRFDGPGGAIEQTYAIMASEKKGLFSLWENKIASFRPPSLVGADASGVYMFSFDWSGVMPMLNRVIEAIPDEQTRMQMQMTIGMFAGGVGPLMDGMRPESVVVESNSRPFSPTSKTIFGALGVHNSDAISEGITAMAPMLGFESRDFLGNQIWESEIGTALGLGFGRLFVGAGEQVEDAMRQAGQDGAAGIVDEDAFRNATALLRGGAMFYTYQNNRVAYEYALWTMANMEAIMRAQFEEMGFDDETIEMILEEEMEDNPFAEIGFPSAELMFRHLGEGVVSEMHSTDDGFRGRSLIYPASD